MRTILDFSKFELLAEREQRSCVGKLRHADAAAAEKARFSMQKKTGEPFDAYGCEFCGFYHIGHSRRDKEQRKAGGQAQANLPG